MPVAGRPIARGDILLIPFPFTDPSTARRRPAVVVGASSDRDCVLAFVTSRPLSSAREPAVSVLPTHPEFALTGLAVPSTIRPSKLVTLSVTLARRWLGRIGPLLTADLDRALTAALAINVVPHREDGRRDERTRLAALHAAGGSRALLADLGLPPPVPSASR